MCWGSKMMKIPYPSVQTSAIRDSTVADAQDPEAVQVGGSKSWETASKNKGISALKIGKPETFEDTLKKQRSAGVNYRV